MSDFEAALAAMAELFSKDCVFALATEREGKPSVRMVDVYWEDRAFYLVTYAGSAKVRELTKNESVALCSGLCRFEGAAKNIGHPLTPENTVIREKLTEAFKPWYFKHNNENDPLMCYVKITPRTGFFHGGGTGYKVDFAKKTAESFPFGSDIILPE
jgi:general stress protein 26